MPTTTQQASAVSRLVRESVQRIDAIAPEQLRALMPVLVQARDELRRDLSKWLATVDGADRFTAYQKAQALRALEATFGRLEETEPAMSKALGIGRKATGPLAVENLHTEVQRLSAIYGGGVPTLPQIDTAAIIAQGNKLLWRRHENSAARYAGGLGDDIKTQFAVALAKGETFEQTTQRMRKLGGFRAAVAASTGHSENAAAISDAMFHRWRFWADRLVRTENMNAYNVQHDLSIEHVNANRGEDEEEYLRRWDASADKVTCERCKELDRTLATIGGEFRYGYKAPPAHPYCRCVVLAWLARWGNFKGEAPAKDHEGKDIAPVPFKAKAKTIPTHAEADGEVRTVPAAKVKEHGFTMPASRLDPVKLDKARKAISEGQRDPVSMVVGKDGSIEVIDGRHRLTAAIEAGAPVKIRFEKGTTGGGDVVQVGGPAAKPERKSQQGSKSVYTPPVESGVLRDKLGKQEQPPEPRKNPKRVAAAQKAAAASVERRREIHGAVQSNLPQELQVAWDKEGHKFMQQEAKRIHGIKDPVNAASKISEAFMETYGSGEETVQGNEGDRFYKRAEIEAKHAESWADEQTRKYYESASREVHGGSSGSVQHEWEKPKATNDDDPPF